MRKRHCRTHREEIYQRILHERTGQNGLGMNAWVAIITQSILPPIIEWVKTAVVWAASHEVFPKSAVNPLNRAQQRSATASFTKNRMENHGFGPGQQ